MCFQALPLILSAVGSGLQMVNQNRALHDRDREVERGMRDREGLRREADTRVRQQIDDVAKSNSDVERRDQNNAFMEALRNAKVADGGPDLGGVGATSDRFAADVGQARAGATQEGQALAGQLAAIDAPALQRQREARTFNDAATDLSMIGDRSNSVDFLTQLRAANAGTPNPGIGALGQGLSAFGSAYAGRANKKPMVPPTTGEQYPDIGTWKRPS